MARSKAQKAQAAANLARMWNTRRNGPENQENEPPEGVAPTHAVNQSLLNGRHTPHWNTIRAKKESVLKTKIKEQTLEGVRRDLRNTKRRERTLRKKNAELKEGMEEMEVDHMTDLAKMQAENERLQNEADVSRLQVHNAMGYAVAAQGYYTWHAQNERQMAQEVARQGYKRKVAKLHCHLAELMRHAWQQAREDVQAVEVAAQQLAQQQVVEAEERALALVATIRAAAARELLEVSERGQLSAADRIHEVELHTAGILHAAEERAASEVRAAEEQARDLVRVAQEHAQHTIQAARAEAADAIRAVVVMATEQAHHAEQEAGRRVQESIHQTETWAAALVEATRDEAKEQARITKARAEHSAAIRIRNAEDHATEHIHAALRDAAAHIIHAEIHAEARVMAAEKNAEARAEERVRLVEEQAEEHMRIFEERAEDRIRGMKDRAQHAITTAEALSAEAVADVEERMMRLLELARADLDDAHAMIEAQSSTLSAEHELREEMQAQLADATRCSDVLWTRTQALQRKNDTLRKRVARSAEQRQRAVEDAVQAVKAAMDQDKSLKLKEKGIIPDSIRALIRDLIALGLKVSQVRGVITSISQCSGVTVSGDLSERSIGRIIGEGYLAAMMQIVEEVELADSITLSGDGTLHRNVPYDARQMEVIKDGEHEHRTLGITSAHNHTSEAQLDGWQGLTSTFYGVYNSSPRGKAQPADPRTFPIKVTGMMTDHAEDQKKLARCVQEWKTACDREVRGEKAYAEMSIPELVLIIAEESMAAVERAGGSAAWAQLSAEVLGAKDLEIGKEVIHRMGQEAFDALPDAERELAEVFVHSGCCMHKDLNAVKGGYMRLAEFWTANGLQGPELLMNRDNEEAAQYGGGARERAKEKSTGGAIKLTDLAGALFRHKDDKKGQQDSFRYFFEEAVGKVFTFPDTSNTRFGSNGDAASVLITYLPLISDFLELIRDKKTDGRWNHLEQNVYRGLQDRATLTELCILSLYSQAISHPYMAQVRGPDRPNHISLGPLHEQVKAHLERIIANPDLLLGPDASHVTGALDGHAWDRPEAFAAVQRLAADLPHIRGGLVAFLQGAVVTWKRFAAEFEQGGAIAMLSKAQQDLVYLPATNDANEGSLGSFRVGSRQATNMSLGQWNGREMYKKNETGTYVATLDTATLKFLRSMYRVVDASGAEKERRQSLAIAARDAAAKRRAHRETILQKKLARQNKLRAIRPMLDLAALTTEKVIVAAIRDQLAWHREWVDTGPRGQKAIPLQKDLKGKEQMLTALREAVTRYNGSLELQQRVQDTFAKFDSLTGPERYNMEGETNDVEEEEDELEG